MIFRPILINHSLKLNKHSLYLHMIILVCWILLYHVQSAEYQSEKKISRTKCWIEKQQSRMLLCQKRSNKIESSKSN